MSAFRQSSSRLIAHNNKSSNSLSLVLFSCNATPIPVHRLAPLTVTCRNCDLENWCQYWFCLALSNQLSFASGPGVLRVLPEFMKLRETNLLTCESDKIRPTTVLDNFLHPGAADTPLDWKSHECLPRRWNLWKWQRWPSNFLHFLHHKSSWGEKKTRGGKETLTEGSVRVRKEVDEGNDVDEEGGWQ